MGLTFKREDNLDTLFDKFAIDPDKKDKELVIDPNELLAEKECAIETDKKKNIEEI